MKFRRIIFFTFFIKLYSIEQPLLDEQIRDHWCLFDNLEKDSIEKALIERANKILDNKKYSNHYLIKYYYSFIFGQSLLSIPNDEAATVICSIKSEKIVNNIITIITETKTKNRNYNYYDKLIQIFSNNKFFLNKENKFRLATILNLDCFSDEAIKKRNNLNIWQKMLFLIYKKRLLLKYYYKSL